MKKEDSEKDFINIYKDIYKKSKYAMMIIAPPNWNFIAGNLATVKMFGCKDEKEFTSQSPAKLSPKLQSDGTSSKQKAMKMIKQALEKGSNSFEWIHRRKNGENFLAEVTLNKVNSNGKNIIQASVKDITKRKESDKNLKIFSTMIEQNPALILITDKKGNITYVNPKFSSTTGYSFEEALNQNPRVLKSGTSPQDKYSELWETITSGNTWKGEFYNKKKNKEYYWASATIFPIKDEKGEVTNFVGIQEDITIKKEIEKKFNDKVLEMEKFQKFASDREIRMIELKKEVNDLLKKLKMPLKYDVD